MAAVEKSGSGDYKDQMNSSLKYPLVVFDLDGTLVDGTIYIWKTLHETFETDADSRQKAYDGYFAGHITYEEWFANDLELLEQAGATRDRMIEVISDLEPMCGARETIDTLRDNGHTLAVISGSLDIVLHQIYGKDTFDYVLINRVIFNNDGSLQGGVPTKYDLERKADGLVELCNKLGISTSQAAFIGDNINDLDIAKKAGLSIAFNCKSPELSQVSHTEIKEKDLRAILSLVN